MIDVSPVDQLLLDKDLSLMVFHGMPNGVNLMRMNCGYPIYYKSLLIDGEQRMWRYLRYKNGFAPLDAVQHKLAQFMYENGVFSVDQFKLSVCQLFTDEAFTKDELTKILGNKPSGADAYNPINRTYWRDGGKGYLERYDNSCSDSHKWLETTIKVFMRGIYLLEISQLTRVLKNK